MGRALAIGLAVLLVLILALAIGLKVSGYRLQREQGKTEAATDTAVSGKLTVEGTEQLAGAAADLSVATDRLRRSAATLDQQAAHDPRAQSVLDPSVLSRIAAADRSLCQTGGPRAVDCTAP